MPMICGLHLEPPYLDPTKHGLLHRMVSRNEIGSGGDLEDKTDAQPAEALAPLEEAEFDLEVTLRGKVIHAALIFYMGNSMDPDLWARAAISLKEEGRRARRMRETQPKRGRDRCQPRGLLCLRDLKARDLDDQNGGRTAS